MGPLLNLQIAAQSLTPPAPCTEFIQYLLVVGSRLAPTCPGAQFCAAQSLSQTLNYAESGGAKQLQGAVGQSSLILPTRDAASLSVLSRHVRGSFYCRSAWTLNSLPGLLGCQCDCSSLLHCKRLCPACRAGLPNHPAKDKQVWRIVLEPQRPHTRYKMHGQKMSCFRFFKRFCHVLPDVCSLFCLACGCWGSRPENRFTMSPDPHFDGLLW